MIAQADASARDYLLDPAKRMRHAVALERIATPHIDPFDRLLLAQCEVETLKLLTAGKTLRKLPEALPC